MLKGGPHFALSGKGKLFLDEAISLKSERWKKTIFINDRVEAVTQVKILGKSHSGTFE
jgi:hypothetical protein